jgi:hypothetical protein
MCSEALKNIFLDVNAPYTIIDTAPPIVVPNRIQ